ncbi:hypothetical protein, partial [Salmonella sp. SAL4437]|uniref:hypothetical protein n=1 Tax=Salmonella sp. SAL4437 TaxID=3159892 RepID=UPI00397999DB
STGAAMSYDQTTSPLLFKIWTFILFFNLQIRAFNGPAEQLFSAIAAMSFAHQPAHSPQL